MSTPRTTAPLDDEERRSLKGLVDASGTPRACAVLDVAPGTLARAIAGLPIGRATATHLRAGMRAHAEAST